MRRKMNVFKNLSSEKPVIGMIHLLALPGSPKYAGTMSDVLSKALRDLNALEAGGVDAIMIENFGDVPFHSGRVGAETVASMTMIASRMVESSKLPFGINVLRNDGESAMSIAAAVGAAFIRVNVLCGARLTDQGIIQGNAHDLMRLRARISPNISVMADIDVKHSAPLAERDIVDETADTLKRGLADSLIVSGSGTGKEVDLQKLQKVHEAAAGAPIFLGSGVSEKNIERYSLLVDGFIVGTVFKEGGNVDQCVDKKRVLSFMKKLRSQIKQ